MTKLFISFTATMRELRLNRVTDEDLATGLFIFGCTRNHTITPGANGEYVEPSVIEYPHLHEKLVAALLRAEADDRVRWRSPEQRNASFRLVNNLLTANGYPRLISHNKAYGASASVIGRDYCYSAVKERCRSKNIEVVD